MSAQRGRKGKRENPTHPLSLIRPSTQRLRKSIPLHAYGTNAIVYEKLPIDLCRHDKSWLISDGNFIMIDAHHSVFRD